MQVGILGPVEAHSPDGKISVGGPRPRTLLALLAIRVGEIVLLDRLIDGLYGAEPPSDAANALQGQVSRLRRALGDASLIEFHPAGYRLALAADQVDAHRFAALAADGQQALEQGDPQAAESLLSEALQLWRGPALADVDAAGHATRLEQQRSTATNALIAARIRLGKADVQEISDLVQRHPLDERLRGYLMQALNQQGRQAEALQAFEDAKALLADELGTDPSAELRAIHLQILRGQSHRELPAQLTTFVGRQEELRRIAALTSRLVTLTGPGGAGKTRLALQSAGPGAIFVDLAPVRDVAAATLQALGLKETVLAPEDRLTLALRERDALLILDNCEHVIVQAAALAQHLLSTCPQLRILATSREALGITGETLCPVPPLNPEQSLALFTDRARLVNPAFVRDEHTVDVCRSLDGLPLAIELAAARTRTLTTEDISARLHDRFRLLTKGNRAAAPRHQTLRAVVEWSWDLLDDDERDLATTFATFSGGATLDAVEQVGRHDIEVLEALVDKSLVEAADGRYRMLETIREFCAQHGRADAEHASYFHALARQADPELRRRNQLHWFAKLSAEHANLVQAVEWTTEHDPDRALRLVSDLSWYWYLKGSRTEIQATAQKLLAKLGEQPTEEYAILLALAAPERVHGVLEQLRGPIRYPFVLVAWAMLSGPPDPHAPRTRLQDEVERSEDPWIQGLISFSAAYLNWAVDGDRGKAVAESRVALRKFEDLGERWGAAQVLDVLANLTEDPHEALALTDQALRAVSELGANEELAEMRCRRADRLLDLDQDEAERDYHQALELASRAGVTATRALAATGLARIAHRRGNLTEAERLLREARGELGFGWMHSTAKEQVEAALTELVRSREA
ncbi:BTAD domain-containing putative transcriptional regulator [Lentzea sp. BCCO 10_0856]|uniref:BTAD domain-containing putative transcriptional regulator n=1 Tax=Lentzea miocenica TaxID=3095431 RepID=A0ABU4SYX9_9PSEU|nr:BTAD domain-containing putative transcriptional regulator [Lentzea sp. BCCO 10_0856]MDX8031128.1 BTAD domain-containing putative transcriptional regulator [Lentzea sp. BCCO 10_0856]